MVAESPQAGLTAPMRNILVIVGIVLCLAVQACAPNVDAPPPDTVLNPRGS
jgi:hypothetical protein